MRPNLSLEHIASTLAALGTTAVLAACGGIQPSPVSATDVTPATATTDDREASCSGHAHPGDHGAPPAQKPAQTKAPGEAGCGAATCAATGTTKKKAL